VAVVVLPDELAMVIGLVQRTMIRVMAMIV
jgi:hypothetical protein